MKLPVHAHSHVASTGEVRDVKPGDIIYFLCRGNGRGGHYSVTAKVTKVNRITIEATECVRSYGSGAQWKAHQNSTNLRILEEFAITPAEMAGVGVYRFRYASKPKAKDIEAFKASVTPEYYEKVLEEAMLLVKQFPSEYRSAQELRIAVVTLKKVPPMTAKEAEAFRAAHPEAAAKLDAEITKVRKEYPEIFK